MNRTFGLGKTQEVYLIPLYLTKLGRVVQGDTDHTVIPLSFWFFVA